MKSILIDDHYSGTKVCIVKDGKLEEFWIERKNNTKHVGNIYKGKVANALQGMQAAFVDIGLERNGFLYAGDVCIDGKMASHNGSSPPNKFPLKTGDIVMCQVLKEEFGNKGARVTMNISLPGRVLVMVPLIDYIGISRKIGNEETRKKLEEFVLKERDGECGFIVRTEAGQCSEEELRLEMRELGAKWEKIKKDYAVAPILGKIYSDGDLVVRAVRDMMQSDVDKVIVNNPAILENIKNEFAYIYSTRPHMFELYTGKDSLITHFNLENQIEGILKRNVPLSNGAYLVIDRTEALTVIDVNTGKYVGEINLEETVFVTNKIAAVEIARQIRLRNLGGIIIVDFIDMVDVNHREEVLRILNEELAKDRIKCSLVGMTDLGLVQITRKKMRNMIDEMMLQPCPYCKGDSYVASEEHIIMRIRDYLFAIFKDHTLKSVKLFVNPLVFTKLFSLRYLERECENEWADKRIYVIPEQNFHIEKFLVEQVRSNIIDLPDSAKLLY